jgi:hypothetical protein
MTVGQQLEPAIYRASKLAWKRLVALFGGVDAVAANTRLPIVPRTTKSEEIAKWSQSIARQTISSLYGSCFLLH